MRGTKGFFLLILAVAVIFSLCSCTESSNSPTFSDGSEDFVNGSDFTTAMHGGTAKTLTGNCLIYNVFVNDAESEWTAKATESVLGMLEEAANFLERRFEESGSDGKLSVRFTDASNSAFLSFDEAAPTDASGMNWLGYAFSKTEHGTPNAYLKQCVKNVSDYDNVCFLFLFNKAGRSFATPYDSQYKDCEDYRYERAQIFFSTDRSFEFFCNPSVLAHELLHLFGAVDLYEPHVDTEDAAKVEELFPTELMRFEPTDIFQAEISSLTAYLIGWTKVLPNEYGFLFD